MRTFVRLFAAVAVFTLSAATPASSAGPSEQARARVAVPHVSGRASEAAPRPFRSSFASLQAARPTTRPTALGTSAPTPASPKASAVPTIVSGFDGIGDIDRATPGDPTGALGDTWFLTAVNVSWQLFDRAGTSVLGPEPLTSVDPSLSGAFAFDPKIVYDQFNDTFVMVFLIFDESPRDSRIVVTTIPNATANDVTTWCPTIVTGDNLAGDGDQWADYPALGYTADRVTIATNQFGFSGNSPFRYAQILSFQKTQLYDCSIPTPAVDVFTGTQTQNADGTQGFTIQPAQTVGTVANDQFLLSFEPRGRDSFLTIWRVREGAVGLSLKRASIPTGPTKVAFLAAQAGVNPADPDFFWDPGDFRLVNAFYDADTNRVYAAHTVRKDFRPNIEFEGYIEAAARWYEIAPAPKLRASDLLRRGVIGESEVEVGWPVVATDQAGNLFVTFNRASPTFDEFISAWIAEIPPGSSSPSEAVLRAGEGVYDVSRGPERWGDYNAIGRDPVLGSVVFAINQFATSSNAFQQSVHLVSHG